MNRKNLAIFCIAAFGPILCPLPLAKGEDLVLNDKEDFPDKHRSSVVFPHGLHRDGELYCTECHHDYRHGRNVLDEGTLTPKNWEKIRCASCHGEKSKNEYNLRDAFHLNCMGCHRKTEKTGKKTGPRLWGECHPRAG